MIENKCPICGDGVMEHRTEPNPKSSSDDRLTHMYICDLCPAVLVEWYDPSDSDAMAKHLADSQNPVQEKSYYICEDIDGCGMVHEDETDTCDNCGGTVREVSAGDIDVF